MSVYDVEAVRINGDIMAAVRIQDDWSGNIKLNVRRIFPDGNDYYCRCDGQRVKVTEQRRRLLDYEDKVKSAFEWERQTRRDNYCG